MRGVEQVGHDLSVKTWPIVSFIRQNVGLSLTQPLSIHSPSMLLVSDSDMVVVVRNER
jgi:hypothetical protein